MKTFYKVTTTFDDKGRVRAFVSTVRASQKPENTFHESRRCDVYEDYFDTKKAAQAFADDAKYA